MKLFDRSVDLARFEEDTPLYPICRAWMANQPRNPQHVVKYAQSTSLPPVWSRSKSKPYCCMYRRRVSSPEPEPWKDNGMLDVHRLPHPVNPCESRCPSPLPEQAERTKDSISLNYVWKWKKTLVGVWRFWFCRMKVRRLARTSWSRGTCSGGRGWRRSGWRRRRGTKRDMCIVFRF